MGVIVSLKSSNTQRSLPAFSGCRGEVGGRGKAEEGGEVIKAYNKKGYKYNCLLLGQSKTACEFSAFLPTLTKGA